MRIPAFLRRFVAAVAVLVAAVVLGIASPAWAVEYPSWSDVLAARENEQAKQAEIARIQGLIAAAQARVEQTQAIAEERGAEYQVAQNAFDAADFRANNLQTQAEQSKADAEAANARAGLLAAQLYRSGGSAELTAGMFLEDGGGADELLARLGSASKLAQINDGVYANALAAQNTAQSLTDQAAVARDEREKLRVEAEQKLQEAIAASEAAQQELADQQELNIVLEQQLAALQDVTAKTTAEYEAGVEAKRKAAEAAAAAARAAAAANAGGPRDGGQLSSQGWAKPAYGWISGTYGYRPGQPAGANLIHRGTDIAASCGSNIYAATSGTVKYAGPLGTYGNWVEISHGDGVTTGYAHIRDGATYVRSGQRVDAGEVIAAVGSTGASTGCHLHFEVRINGSAIDAQPFMRDRGAALG
ncbi:peptidoglycan DD-metalloendopeptidase family protein [Naasia sp. SYSU D00057]|uniref:peptidoglycan DD-metalloendopeptidase family protein n=1 Tax=Naasia sp. SYSU D00057 TaxID=2817380 RepID=UPI0027DBA1AA|nr:peptidoglycan DD-metalloendopeptidase family protein [Naasia sp. SYSU D00057]